MSTPLDIEAIAQEVKSAQDEARQIEPLTGRIDGFDVSVAYQVAAVIHDQRLAEGRTPVGRKIGFTNSRIWSEYGVHEPIWGYVYDTTLFHTGAETAPFSLRGLCEPKIEPEIVLHLGSTPPADADAGTVLRHVDWVAHSFEIVQTQFPGWRFQAPDTIAGQGLHGALVVGPPMGAAEAGANLEEQLEQLAITLSCDGDVRDTGRGFNVLGSPLKAVAHLIAVLEGLPDAPPLQAGELLTTGTVTAAHAIKPGETWSTEVEGIALPGLSVRFGA